VRRRFFVDRFDGDRAILRGETAEHLGRVLRAEPGQLYELSDGQAVWLGRIEDVRRDAIRFALVEPIEAMPEALRIRLLLSIIKFDHFEWCIEKATELGVSEIVPLAAARSEKTLIAAAEKRSRRWEKILVESAQQSRRLRAPALAPVAKPLASFTSTTKSPHNIFLSENPEALPIRNLFMAASADKSFGASQAVPAQAELLGPAHPSVTLAIGPEGGWTDEEAKAARQAGFVEASLGKNILRTETAVIAALAVINYALGE
jgi:16S rRNA (uracil1498-N3)-methyltransferase